MNIITRTYESLLPFLVVEAISSHKMRFNNMSFKMMDKGWAWLVSGRKLLVWRFKDNKTVHTMRTRRTLSPCFELQLPQSDLVHKAELIQVFFLPQNLNVSTRAVTVPAALVVSPAGIVRFWSNIANERFTETSFVEMSGQVLCTLEPLSTFEYLLATTTGSIYLLTIDISIHDSKRMFTCIPLTEPSGLLSGISRRMTNIIFGPLSTDANIGKRPLIAVLKYTQSTVERTGSRDRPFFVLSSSLKLHQWARSYDGDTSSNHLIREWNLQKNIYEELLGGLGLTESDPLELWLVDMITTKSKELLILLVVLDRARDNVNYVTCGFNPYQAGDSISNLTILRSHTRQSSNESEDQLTSFRFIERQAKSSTCFVYDRQFLFLVQADQDIMDAIDYGNQNDSILGAGMIDNHPILFTQRDGLTYVVPVASNKSKLNDTSIQLETPNPISARAHDETVASQRSGQDNSILTRSRHDNTLPSRSMAASNRMEPMLVELDEEEDNDQSTSAKPDNRLNHSRQIRGDKSRTSLNRSMNESSSNKIPQPVEKSIDEQVEDLLKESKEFEWMQQIENRQYALASATLEKLAVESENLKEWQETFQALSKLAKLAE